MQRDLLRCTIRRCKAGTKENRQSYRKDNEKTIRYAPKHNEDIKYNTEKTADGGYYEYHNVFVDFTVQVQGKKCIFSAALTTVVLVLVIIVVVIMRLQIARQGDTRKM